jgi:hypothetical protein
MDAKSKRGCLWAAAGGCLLLVIVGAALVVGGGWLAYQNLSLQTEQVTEANAEVEFEQLRERFAGQQPLVVIDEHGAGRVVPRESRASAPIEWVHLVAYDPGDGKVTRMRMPFWLLRLAPGQGDIKFGNEGEVDLPNVQLTMQDVEAAGPGLILDHTDARGQQVLIWAE